jgi:adenylate kinase
MLKIPHTFIFIGRSGSGKGTQAQELKSFIESNDQRLVTYVQTGQRFRDFTATDTHTASLARKVIEEGALMPEFLGVWNWSSIFVEQVTGAEHMILDGMPRRLREAHILDSAMEFYERQMPLVIYIDISKEEAKRRLLLRGRGDDVESEIDRRLAWFETDVLPVIEFYERDRKYNFIRVDGEKSVEEIQSEIQNQFNTLYGYNN